MIPCLGKPRYKPLVRLRADIWNNLKRKSLKKKKWRPLITFLERKKRWKKKRPVVISYEHKPLPKFPIYHRYRYQKNLFIRKGIKIRYGNLQEYKIKKIALQAKRRSWIGFAHRLEQNAISIVYRFKFTATYGEAAIHFKRKHIFVNDSSKKLYIRKGDVLHFSPYIKELYLKRIWYKSNNRRTKRVKFQTHLNIDFDVNTFHFYFIENIKYFRNHPFRLPIEKLWRWYTRV